MSMYKVWQLVDQEKINEVNEFKNGIRNNGKKFNKNKKFRKKK